MTNYINKVSNLKLTPEEVAYGFITVANEAMCRPIKSLTQARGYDPKDHILSIFGGAGGQHACGLAKLLDIPKVYINKYAGILSAYGLSKAEIVEELQEPVNRSLSNNPYGLNEIESIFKNLEEKVKVKLSKLKTSDSVYKIRRYLLLRYEGNDYNLTVEENEKSDFTNDFVKAFNREWIDSF